MILSVPERVPELVHVVSFVPYERLNPLLVCLSYPVFREVAASEASVV